jgi:phytoene dehydrogenase-like protein
MKQYDVIIIGAGPNGLAAGAYLCRSGLKVLLLERQLEAGGGLASEEATLPRFIHNTHAIYHLMVDYAPPYKDFDLEKENVKYIYPDLQFAMPLSSGKSLCIYKDVDKTCASIAQFSRKDAETYREINRKFQVQMDNFLAAATYVDPIPAPLQAAMLESTELGKEISSYTSKSPRSIVEELYENEHVRALMLYIAAHWGLEPDVDGIGYLAVLCLNRASHYQLCVGGSHSLAQALIRIILHNGGMIWGSQRIKRILVNNGTATGVEMENGRVIEADKAVISTIDPIQTFIKYVGKENLSEEFIETTENFKWEHWSLLTVHLALDKAPLFKDPSINNACVYAPVGIETEEELLSLWGSITTKGELVTKGFNACFPSAHDPSQAPVGRHTGLISQMAPYHLKEGSQKYYNYLFKEEIAERCLETLRKYTVNLNGENILWRITHTPLDFENRFLDMVSGSIKQGAYEPLQLGFLRPNEFCSNHRTPIGKLYLGGASSHSGGLITFGPGYGVANAVADDLGVKKWWGTPDIVTKAREKGLLP